MRLPALAVPGGAPFSWSSINMLSSGNGEGNSGAAVELAESRRWSVFPVWWVDGNRQCACGNPNCDSPGKHPLGALVPHGLKQATADVDQLNSWWSKYPLANIGVRTGPESGLWVPDLDGADGIRQFQQLADQHSNLPQTPTVATGGGGRHLYFAWPADHTIKNQTKVGGLSIDIRGLNGYVLAPPSNHVSGQGYRWEIEATKCDVAEAPAWLLDFADGSPGSPPSNSGDPLVFAFEDDLQSHPGAEKGGRNDVLCRLVGKYLVTCGITSELLPLAMEWGARCRPPLDERQVRRTVVSLIEKHQEQEAKQTRLWSLSSLLSQPPPWPEPIDEAAFHGLAGDIVRTIEPHSETDPVAILVQVLAAFGNAIGRSAYFAVESDRHYLKVFLVLVGPTSKGRKGTSWGHVRRLFGTADEAWAKDHISQGLSSGEGLIWAVRDEIRKKEPVKEKGKVIEYHEVISDEGVLDKRLLIVEPEFASTLRVLGAMAILCPPSYDPPGIRVIYRP